MSFLKSMSILNQGLRYKLMLAFSLMTVIPLLCCTYIISTYLFPQLDNIIDVSVLLFISLIVALLGLVVARGIVDHVVDMAVEARMIAQGSYDRKISISSEDEIGTIGESINFMTYKIKSNLDDLKGYGQKMKEINVDIHKKVFTLSSLLQVGDAISSLDMPLDTILEMAVEKAASLFEGGFGCIYLPRSDGSEFLPRFTYNLSKEKLNEIALKHGGHGVLDSLVDGGRTLVIDRGSKPSKEIEQFRSTNNIRNLLANPINCGKKVAGVIVIGNRTEDFKYKEDDLDLIKTFSRQIAIAIENEALSKKTEGLVMTDDLTGLYNKNYIMLRLEEEIKRAIFYQRPCSFVIFNVDGFRKFRDAKGELVAEEALKRMAKILKDNTIPVGKTARIGGDEFAMVLPEKNKKEASFIADDIRNKIGSSNLLKEGKASLTVSCGVAENPIDGMTSDELLRKALDSLQESKAAGGNTVST